jgi:hypothetical protein
VTEPEIKTHGIAKKNQAKTDKKTEKTEKDPKLLSVKTGFVLPSVFQ